MLFAIPNAIIAYWITTRGPSKLNWLWLFPGATIAIVIEVLGSSLVTGVSPWLMLQWRFLIYIALFQSIALAAMVFLMRRVASRTLKDREVETESP